MRARDLLEKWSKKYKRSIDCSHPRGFSQRAHCQGRKKHNEDAEADTQPTLMDALRDFFPVVMQHLDLDHLPRITFVPEVTGHHAPTFGKFMNAENTIFVDIENRHPNDILRTLAHELVHYRQLMDHQLDASSGETGSDEENQANAQAGVIMRNFNQQYPHYLDLEPVILPAKKTHISESHDATPAQQWIRKIYDEFHEHPFNPRYRVMTWGSGDDQELAIFELAPVFGKPTTVDIKWFQAYPQRQGIGTRAMQRLQQLALEHGITLTIYPWNRGEVSQSKLTKIYKGMGFRPTARGAKDMSWQPKQQSVTEGSDQITELRDRMYQYIKSIVPNWPDYVVQDWLYKGSKTDTKDGIIEKISGAGLAPNSKWQLVPYMKFTMDMFDPITKQRLMGRAGGTSDLGMGIPKDKERHATQAALAQQQGGVRKEPVLLIKTAKGYELLEGWHRTIQHFVKYPNGYTGPAYVAVAQGQQGVAEGQLNESLSSMVAQDQDERNEYKQFVKSQAGGDWSKGAKLYAQLKKRPSDDIFGDKQRLNQFMKIKFDFDKFTDDDWNNYWLLAQHCDMNRNFQKQALSIIKKYQGPDSSHYKYLYDRISCAITGTQKYGTQSLCGKDHQELSETFDQPYPLTWEHSEYGDVDALATLDDGTHLSVMFSEREDDHWRVEFYRNNSQQVTGQGDAHRVFATVLAAIAEFVKKQQPRGLSFAAVKGDEDDDSTQDQLSRIKLYDRLVQRYAQSVGYGVTRVDKTHLVAYKLTRLKQELSEQQHQDYMAGHCHVMAIALKLLHPDWQIRAHIGWDDDEAEDHEYRVDHVYIVAPDGSAYDCRGRFDHEDQLVGPDTTGGIDTQYVDLEVTDIKQLISRGELKQFTKQDIVDATEFAKQIVNENFKDGRNPQDKGDSKRYGVPTRASVSTLRKVAKQGGRRGQLAHWMANMKSGRAKAKK